MKRIRIAILALVAASVLVSAAPASAAWGTVGGVTANGANCFNNQITVAAPHMTAVPVNTGVFVTGPSHTQVVGYQAWIYHVESATWIPGGWKLRYATDDGLASLFDDQWFDWNSQSWRSGATSFSINRAGTYWAYAQYHWFADRYVGAGGYGEFIDMHNYNSGRLGTAKTCQF